MEKTPEQIAEEMINANLRSSEGIDALIKPFADAIRADREAMGRRVEELEATLKWVRQTVHQAHHEGEIETCRKNTCDAVTKTINPKD